ncbi:MAG: NTP transferase domain-containing protein, partial [Acidimicrobiia bacterium]
MLTTQMNAVILAGGAGRKDHFRPLAFPRPLLPLANRPLLEHQLAWLAEGGVQHAVVAVDHRGASLASPSLAGIDVRLSYAPVPMGADSGLLRAACGSADRLLVVDGSLLTDVDIPGLVAAHRRSGAAITVAAPQGGPGSACLLVAERSALDAIRAGRPDPVGGDVHLVVDPVACAGGRFPRRH